MINIFKWFLNKMLTLNKLIITVSLMYFVMILRFVLTSYSFQLSQNQMTNKILNISIIVLLGFIGYAGVLVLRRILCINMFDNRYIRILLVVLITLIPRLIWISIVDITPHSDFALYNGLAESFSTGEAAGGKYVALFPHTFGYPFILGIVYNIFSTDKYLALVLNVVFGIGIGVLIYSIGGMISNWKAGFAAAVIWALWPSHVFYSSLVCTESLYTFLMLLLIYTYFKISSKNLSVLYSSGLYLLIGILCSITNSIRPLGPILILALGIIEVGRIIDKRGGLKCRIVFFIPYIVLLISYFSFFNLTGIYISHKICYQTAKNPIGFNLYVGSNINSLGIWNMGDAQVLSDMISEKPFDAQKVHDKLKDMAIQRIKAQGTRNLKLMWEKNRILWGNDDEIVTYMLAGSKQEELSSKLSVVKYSNLLRHICNLYYYVFVILAFFGLCKAYKMKDSYVLTLLLLLFLGIGGIHTIVEVHGRYHYSAVVIISIIAGIVADKKTNSFFGSLTRLNWAKSK